MSPLAARPRPPVKAFAHRRGSQARWRCVGKVISLCAGWSANSVKNKPWSFGASAHRIFIHPRLMPALRHPYAISVSVSLIYNFESLSLYQNSKSPKHYGYRSFSNDSRAVTCNGRQKLTFIFIYVYTFVYILIYITHASGESVGWVPMLETSLSGAESDRLKYAPVEGDAVFTSA